MIPRAPKPRLFQSPAFPASALVAIGNNVVVPRLQRRPSRDPERERERERVPEIRTRTRFKHIGGERLAKRTIDALLVHVPRYSVFIAAKVPTSSSRSALCLIFLIHPGARAFPLYLQYYVFKLHFSTSFHSSSRLSIPMATLDFFLWFFFFFF
jgi:hypothetical protein